MADQKRRKDAKQLIFQQIYEQLNKQYGDLNWWPAQSPYEVMIGAILTQNTNWKNVEKAINNLVDVNCLTSTAISLIPIKDLAELIRPSGYFNIKADRLKSFNSWYVENGEYEKLTIIETATLRDMLLSIKGVGPETADDILLYAFERPVFVVDAYFRRIFSRIGIIEKDTQYEMLRSVAEQNISNDTQIYNQYHALLVEHCKKVCKVKPNCYQCVLADASICSFQKISH